MYNHPAASQKRAVLTKCEKQSYAALSYIVYTSSKICMPPCTLLVPHLYPGSVPANRGNWPPHKGVCIKNSAARHTCLNVNSYISTCMQASRCISIYLPSMSDVHIILLPHKNALRLQNVKNNHMLHFGTRLC